MAQINFSEAFPSYLKPLFYFNFSFSAVIGILVGFVITGFILWLYLEYLRLQKERSVKYVYLEVKPTDRTLKTPLSTTQLFASLHSLITPDSSGILFTTKKSISFELVSTKEQGIRYILRVPKGVENIVYKNLLAYLPGIEINFIDDYLTPKLFEDGITRKMQRAELQFKDSYLFPLKPQEMLSQHDPISFTTAHMTKPVESEMIIVEFICSPINDATHSSATHIINKINERLSNNLDIADLIKKTKFGLLGGLIDKLFFHLPEALAFIALSIPYFLAWLTTNTKEPLPFSVFDKPKRKQINELGENKRQQYQKIHSKISEPLFETTVRMIVINPHKEETETRIKGLFSSFETFNFEQQKVKLYKNFMWNLGYNFTNNIFKNIELKDRLSIFGKPLILSTSELASLYHLPYTSTTKTEDLLQVKSPQLPAPLSLKQSSTQLDIVFAYNRYGETITSIGQTLEQRRRHTYAIGATGTGKSNFLLQMIYQDIINGKGLAVLDPHGELVELLLGLIPKERRKDVYYFNPYDVEHPIGLNLLKLPKNLSKVELDREKGLVVSTLIAIFHKLYPERYSGPRMEHLLRNVVLTALETENPTLSTIYRLLIDSKYRNPIVDSLKDEHVKRFWRKEFGGLGSFMKADQVMPITNKLGTFLTTIITKSILDNPDNNLDLSEIMNGKKILLCNLSKGRIGEDNSYFLGSLLIAEIQRAALRRVQIKEQDRQDFFLYIDEFQNFATKSFADILSEARKYRLGAIMAHQNTIQIDSELLDTIIGNSGTVITFRTQSPLDEEKLLPLYAPKVELGQIQNLPAYTFYIKINALQPQDVFTGEVKNFSVKYDQKVADEVIKLSQQTYGKKITSQTPVENIQQDIKKEEKTPANLYKRG